MAVQEVAHGLRAEGFDASEDGTGRGTPLVPVAFGGNNTAGPISVATAVNAHAVPHGRCDFESETFVVAGSDAVAFSIMPMNSGKDYKAREVAVAQPVMAAGPAGPAGGNQGGDYIVQPMAFALRGREEGAVPEVEGIGDATSALRAASGGSSRDYVAFTAKDHGGDAGEVAPTVRGGNHDKSWANGGVMPAVAGAFGVRRLTPRECERLMGFPDDHTLIPWRKGLAPDGPRYKAIGNSMAVPVMSWLGHRIQMVEDLMERS